MKRIDTELPGVCLLEPRVFGDERGFFLESYNQRVFADLGIPHDFVQDNHSASARGVLRGLHYQLGRPQGKLVRVVSGAVFDVAIDIRRGSPNFGQWIGFELSAENHRLAWIPAGFAHGFLVLSQHAEFLYKCTDFYAPEEERGIRWDCPRLAIDWPMVEGTGPELSAKDRAHPGLEDLDPAQLPGADQ